jgi:enterochelin esterase-like enzyme
MYKYIFCFSVILSCTPVAAQTGFQNFIFHVNTLSVASEKTAAIDSFMAYARTKGIPFIEGDTVNFVYRGSGNSATVSGDMNGWSITAAPMARLNGTNFFFYSQRFEMDARLDYKFVIDGGNWILDPENPHFISGGYGPNSELAMPEYVQPWEVRYKASAEHGSLISVQLHSDSVSANYSLSIYLPPGYDTTRSYPSVYFQDGSDYLAYGNSKNVIDNLLDSNLIQPFIGVFVTPNNRNEEYAGSLRTRYRSFFVNELVPFIDSNYKTKQDPSQRLVIGDSYGGNISALICFYHSDVFGNAGLHSAAFQPNNYEVCDLFQYAPKKNIKVASVWGLYEPPLTQNLRVVTDSLLNKGYQLIWKEVHEGHSWGEWRANTDFILEYIFPPLPTGIYAAYNEQPKEFQLNQNYPNPFNPATTISYTLPSSQFVSLKVYNTLGQEMATLVQGFQEPGNRTIRFDGNNFPSGVYIYRLTSQSFSESKKMILMK